RWTPAFFASLSEPSQKKLPAPARFGRRVYMSASGQDFHGGTLEGNYKIALFFANFLIVIKY
ncbi:MAG: hypothetical protein PHF61_11575, partial [Bacteroidales bacterium]|nr:hypothetical protein [Bacteroidales bacterium]